MKRVLIAVLLVALFAGAYWAFSARRPAPAAPVAPVAAASAPSPEQEKRDERRALFGDEALAPAVQWRDSGLGYQILSEGTPPKPGIGAEVRITYIGRLKNGTVFDRSDTPTKFLIGGTIPGLSVGLQMLGTGGKAVFFIPPSLAYGNRKVLGIPPGSGLIFEVQVADVRQG